MPGRIADPPVTQRSQRSKIVAVAAVSMKATLFSVDWNVLGPSIAASRTSSTPSSAKVARTALATIILRRITLGIGVFDNEVHDSRTRNAMCLAPTFQVLFFETKRSVMIEVRDVRWQEKFL
jgi:hypothetical protein